MSNDSVIQYGELVGDQIITNGGKLLTIQKVKVDSGTRVTCSRCGRYLRFVFVAEDPYHKNPASHESMAIVFGSTCQHKQSRFEIHSVYEMVYPGDTPDEVENQRLAPRHMRPRMYVT